MDKKKLLQEVKEEMEADKTLPLINRPEDVIPGEGNSDAILMFIGEAGGYHESVQRRPFVGRAGSLLNHMLLTIKLPREEVYITNMVKTRPPENRDPTPDELRAYGNYLDKEIEIVNPKVIATLGRFSMAKFLPGVYISNVHGEPKIVDWRDRKITVMPMYHPAAALRNGNVKESFRIDFLKLPGVLAEIKAQEPTSEQLELV